MNQSTINMPKMREINRSAILEYVRQNTPTSRTTISTELGVSMTTVKRVLEDLLEEKLILQGGPDSNKMGRKREMLHFNYDAYSVIGVDLGGTSIYGAIANLAGEIKYEKKFKIETREAEASFETVCQLIQNLLDNQDQSVPVKGLMVGAPGVTRTDEGVVEWAPSLQWKEYPLALKLFERFQIPVLVDNDVNLSALGELWFGEGIGHSHLMLINIGTGVGAGIIIDGQIYRGSKYAGGEIGYTCLSIDDLNKTYKNFGAFESRNNVNGILLTAQKKLKEFNITNIEIINVEDIFKYAEEGQTWADEAIKESLKNLALVMVNAATLLDVDMIVLGGYFSNRLEKYLPYINGLIEGVIPVTPEICISKLGNKAAVMGSVISMLRALDNTLVVRSFTEQ